MQYSWTLFVSAILFSIVGPIVLRLTAHALEENVKSSSSAYVVHVKEVPVLMSSSHWDLDLQRHHSKKAVPAGALNSMEPLLRHHNSRGVATHLGSKPAKNPATAWKLSWRFMFKIGLARAS